MKNTTKVLCLITCCVFSFIISAKELTGIFRNIFHEEWFSDSKLISWISTSNTPKNNTTSTYSILFDEGFENDANNSGWEFANPTYNKWYIGKAAASLGEKGLYISSSYGNANEYSNPFLSANEYAYAISPSISLPNGITTTELSFDWRNNGEGNAQGKGVDYLSVWVIPASFKVAKDTDIATANSGGIEITTDMYNQSSFVKKATTVDLTKFAGTAVKLVFKWVSNDSTVNNPAAAIDNIVLATTTCSSVATITPQSIGSVDVALQWTYLSGVPQQVDFYVSTSNQKPSDTTTATHQSTQSNYTITGLQGNTLYYIWYRTVCSTSNKGYWTGPLLVETACAPISVPFKEGFNAQNASLKCWTIVDENKDNKGWGYTKSAYEGNQAVNFTSTGSKTLNDDWFYSPVFKLSKGTYKLSFYYKGTNYNYAGLKIALSDKGIGKANFTTSILPLFSFTNTNYEKKDVVFTIAKDGNYNLAFIVDNQHSSAQSVTQFTIDDFRLEKEDCVSAITTTLGTVADSSASFSWQDPTNQSWEYFVVEQPQDKSSTFPVKPGVAVTANTAIATIDNNSNTPIKGNTVYDFYVRSICQSGGVGSWSGPLTFKTPCSSYTLPFTDDFEQTTTKMDCWKIVDNNKDEDYGKNKWNRTQYQGVNSSYAASFEGSYYSSNQHDDYLITPGMTLNGGMYKLTYSYKTGSSKTNSFQLLLSVGSDQVKDFTTVLSANNTSTTNGKYVDEIVYISGITGVARLAWYINGQKDCSLSIDNIKVEEVDCSSVLKLEAKAIQAYQADITWEDNINAKWEYWLQEKKGIAPTSKGIATSTKNNTVVKDINGQTLKASTEYEFYVRVHCNNGNYTAWEGPYVFKTACGIVTLPFTEIFSSTSPSRACWTVLDQNKDEDTYYGDNKWRFENSTSSAYEGNGYAYFENYNAKGNDDWLISPLFTAALNTYRVTFYVKGSSNNTSDLEVSLLQNGSTTTGKTVLLPVKTYTNSKYEKYVAYFSNVQGDYNIGWHIKGNTKTTLSIGKVSIEKVNCADPINLEVDKIQSNEVTVKWQDAVNSKWEYVIAPKGSLTIGSTTKGTEVSAASAQIKEVTLGVALQSQTEYDVYVRAVCATNSYGDWVGPITFKTTCSPFNLPFKEGFESTSTSLECWKIIDNNNDSSYGDNKWVVENSGAATGKSAIKFYSYSSVQHDDYLISPTLKLTNKLYRLRYKYKAKSSGSNTFRVLLSESGSTISSFTQEIWPTTSYSNGVYEVQDIYIQGNSKDINIAWHANGTGSTTIYLDDIEVEEVQCSNVANLTYDQVKDNQVVLNWEDTINKEWEYWLQQKGGAAPTSKGVATTSTSNIATKDINNQPLKAQTEYEFYVRVKCSGNSYTDWVGPIAFKTTCSSFALPFKESFEDTPLTHECWTIVDNNKDASSQDHIWGRDKSNAATGSYTMSFYSAGFGSKQHDDYLISPTIKLTNKMYRLRYKYKVSSYGDNTFSVLLSENGVSLASFTQVLVPTASYNNTKYLVQDVYIQGNNKDINIAWYVNGKDRAEIYLDDIEIEEVACSNVTDLSFANVKHNQADLSWKDTLNANWEYWLQEKGGAAPTSKGVATTSTKNTVTKDINNQPLKAQTEYEFYVRVLCANGGYTEWVGPVSFKTTCGVATLPLAESFDTASTSKECWSILDVNKDQKSGDNIWRFVKGTSSSQQGDGYVYFENYSTNSNDDWLISPVFKATGDTYKVSFYVKGDSYNTSEMEVFLLQDSSIATKVSVLPAKVYKNAKYEKYEAYFSGVTGDYSIGWYINGATNTRLYLDTVTIEKVNCAAPVGIEITNVLNNQVDFKWNDIVNKQWQYYIAEKTTTTTTPSGAGTLVNSSNTVATQTTAGVALKAQTEYVVYVRAMCGTQPSDWIGPATFKTACDSFALPFKESFEDVSNAINCWSTTTTTGAKSGWSRNQSNAADGSYSMRFYYGANGDDYLISPRIDLSGKLYRLRYKYKVANSKNNSFSVLLSTKGSALTEFTTVLLPTATYTNTTYQTEDIYLTGYQSAVNIAWKVDGNTSTTIYLDDISIEEVDCINVSGIVVNQIQSNQVHVNWIDTVNQSWEYAVQEPGKGVPTGKGTSATTTNNVVTKDVQGQPLKANTAYEVYVRVLCGNGKYTEWVGPVSFETSCGVLSMPYKETFETTSSSRKCWTILDVNKDENTSYKDNKWRYENSSSNAYEGSGYAYFENYNATSNDDWLISPIIASKGETYKVTYYVKGNSSNTSELEVHLLKDANSSAPVQTLQVAKVHKNAKYEQVVMYFSNVVGNLNIGWYIKGATRTNLYIDQVTIDIVNCEDPTTLQKVGAKSNEVSFEWTDSSNTAWEYWVQEKTTTAVVPTTNGVATTTKGGVATQTADGKPLKPQTDYEVYVRSKCKNGTFTDWTQPIVIRTTCAPLSIPFIENFEDYSGSLECWKMEDANKDQTNNGSNSWKLSTKNPHEGNKIVVFEGSSSSGNHDDYLISPTFKGTSNTVKLTYFYKGSSSVNSELEVLLSTNGTALSSFTKVLVAKDIYKNDVYEQKVVYITNVSSDFTIAWHAVGKGSSSIAIDLVTLEEVNCTSPTNVVLPQIWSDSVSVSWTDPLNTSWEYWIQELGNNLPNKNGVVTTTNTITAKQDINGNPLLPSTYYEVYVRAKCVDGSYTAWENAVFFKTPCSPLALSFLETFDTSSTTKDCWTIVDNGDKDQNQNIWTLTNKDVYQGDGAMSFKSSYYNKGNDDWLISPSVVTTASKYVLTYYYKTGYYDTEVEVLLSNAGVDTSKFTTSIIAKKKYKSGNYIKEEVVFQGTPGIANIAWHLTGSGSTEISIDNVSIAEQNCEPIDMATLKLGVIDHNSISITWQDTVNKEWEFYTTTLGGTMPTSQQSGTVVTTQQTKLMRLNTSGSMALQPQTEYEFYVRTRCGNGNKGNWVGPIKFRTACGIQAMPFKETFNSKSVSLECWSINDFNKDNSSWTKSSYSTYEGDGVMNINSKKANDDWLISPQLDLDPTKVYRLTYYYKISGNNEANVEVLLATKSNDVADFTTKISNGVIQYKNSQWKEAKYFITKTSKAYIAIRELSNGGTNLYIDNFNIEEVQGCAEVVDLAVNNVKRDEVTLLWDDTLNANNYEYVVQQKGGGVPTANGVKTTSKTAVVQVDQTGKKLQPLTEYEYYVRTVCGGANSIWVGPFEFKTACGAYKVPFYESFDTGSTTSECWTINDGNKDGDFSGYNSWKTTYSGAKGSAMLFESSKNAAIQDDWLISPMLETKANKYYRLKYKYLVNGSGTNKEFEVKLSYNGVATGGFTQTVVPKKDYPSKKEWVEETTFFYSNGGEINIGWHVVGKDSFAVYIDEVTIEEVNGCPEPQQLTLQGVGKTNLTFAWTDTMGATEWEYYIQPVKSGKPTGNGVKVNSKTVVGDKDSYGKTTVKPNGTYEIYVRTVCGTDGYSDWVGPIIAETECDVYSVPFEENFDTTSLSWRCWTVLDANKDGSNRANQWLRTTTNPYEGNQAVVFEGSSNKQHDDWLISPLFDLDGGDYLLKYQYMSSDKNSVDMEVMLSANGLKASDFKTTLLSKKRYANKKYVEEIILVKGIKGKVNIGWHVVSNGNTLVYIDKVSLKKIDNCVDPVNVVVTDRTETSITAEWQQYGNTTQWEVVAVPLKEGPNYKKKISVVVNGTPKATITNLSKATAYTIYVRALCKETNNNTNWSTGIDAYTANSEFATCEEGKALIVNVGTACTETNAISMIGTPVSLYAEPKCGGTKKKRDSWFSFVAEGDTQIFELKDFVSISGNQKMAVYATLYESDCASMNVAKTRCFDFSGRYTQSIQKQMVKGKTYLLRLATEEEMPDFYFNLCITSPQYVKVEESGKPRSVEELVKKVLVTQDCDVVDNVTFISGEKYKDANSIGYYNSGNAPFAFKDGIVLATSAVTAAAGPSDGSDRANGNAWVGDKDLDVLLKQMKRPDTSKNATVLEFDFIPMVDTLKFDFIFASNEYGQFQCNWSDIFAFLLTDLTTNEVSNLAVIPGTNTPVSVTNIRNREYNTGCESVNADYFDAYFGKDEIINPVGYTGYTIPMTAKSPVQPGRKYHIKLAIANYGDTRLNSAVFLKGGSFDLGKVDLGKDLLIKEGTALCPGTSKILKSGVEVSTNKDFKIDIKWFKDGKLLPNLKTGSIEVNDTGTYKIEVEYIDFGCRATGEVVVEVFPTIKSQVKVAAPVQVCTNFLGTQTIDLGEVEKDMKGNKIAELESMVFTYHYTAEEAMTGENPIVNPQAYAITFPTTSQRLYIRIVDTRGGCLDMFDVLIEKQNSPKATVLSDAVVCGSFVLPMIGENERYYTKPNAEGEEYLAGSMFEHLGKHTLYIVRREGDMGCFEQSSFNVEIVEPVYADHIENQIMECELFVLPELSAFNKYFTEPNGKGKELLAGTTIYEDQKIFIYASSPKGVCVDESSFEIQYTDCPIPKGISPNGDGINDVFDLSLHGVLEINIFNRLGRKVYHHGLGYTKQWDGRDNKGVPLPSGTYYYVINTHGKTRTGWVQVNR